MQDRNRQTRAEREAGFAAMNKGLREEVQYLPLSELKPFEAQPFKVRMDDSMNELVDSVKMAGVVSPLIVRPHKDGGYEILSGHRRAKASELAGRRKVPVIVKELDDDTAAILLVDSNLQRENILPSEKAYAYQLKLEAMKRQGARTDLTSGQIGQNTHEPIIDEETFEKVQLIANQRKNEYHERLGKFSHLEHTENILQGLVWCPNCQRPLVCYKNVSHGKKLWYTYICISAPVTQTTHIVVPL